jgi:outer membrane protein assembly factor BamA
MSGPARAAIGAAILLLVCVSPARGQTTAQDPLDRLIGLPIVGIEVRIEGTPDTSPALLALVDIRPGDRLTPEAWRRVSERFNHVPRFESVRVLVEEPPGGVLLIFDLTPRHPIDRLEFTFKGAAVLPIEDLERQVRDRFNGLPAPTERIEVEEEVEKILANEGYLSAVVTTALERFHDPDRSTLGVTVEAGPRTLIGTIDLRGQSTLDPSRTLARRGVVVGAPFREREVEAALADVRDELRRKQYYTAIAQHQPTVSSDGATVALAVTVEAGQLGRS